MEDKNLFSSIGSFTNLRTVRFRKLAHHVENVLLKVHNPKTAQTTLFNAAALGHVSAP